MSWAELTAGAPELAAHARERLHGRISYLATVDARGAPRVHPVLVSVAERALHVFMEPASPKGNDLRRGSRYALHCGVEDNEGGGGEVFLRGAARPVEDAEERADAAAAWTSTPEPRYVLFELLVDEAVATTYAADEPQRERWRAG